MKNKKYFILLLHLSSVLVLLFYIFSLQQKITKLEESYIRSSIVSPLIQFSFKIESLNNHLNEITNKREVTKNEIEEIKQLIQETSYNLNTFMNNYNTFVQIEEHSFDDKVPNSRLLQIYNGITVLQNNFGIQHEDSYKLADHDLNLFIEYQKVTNYYKDTVNKYPKYWSDESEENMKKLNNELKTGGWKDFLKELETLVIN